MSIDKELPNGNNCHVNADSGSKNSSRREATEERLLDALETVLVRDGIRQLTLNAVVAEADCGKPLVYRYFGGLPGLLSAWAERRGVPDADADVANMPEANGDTDHAAFLEAVAERMTARADAMRDQPVLLEMLAEELTAQSELTEPFARARQQQSRTFVRAMLEDPRYNDPDIRGKIIISLAALNYLAMRARRSPRFMGLRLDTDAGWQDALAMVRRLILR